jgi:hypothetical protein
VPATVVGNLCARLLIPMIALSLKRLYRTSNSPLGDATISWMEFLGAGHAFSTVYTTATSAFRKLGA